MHRRLYAYASPLIALVVTGGCAQMTRHSNMVLFGTNTSVGLRVGTSATSVPEIQFGYSRQEAVAMPVVANTGSTGNGQDNLLQPCNLTQEVGVTGARYAVHPCSLVAVNGSAMDSYSVLASFGANFDASRSTTTTAKGGLAQYFSTGMAAQILALTGGASVVAVGEAAREQAEHQPSPAAVQALFGNPAAYQQGIAQAPLSQGFVDQLIRHIEAVPNDSDVAGKITTFETNSGFPAWIGLRAACTTKAACVAAVRLNADNLRQAYITRQARADEALRNW